MYREQNQQIIWLLIQYPINIIWRRILIAHTKRTDINWKRKYVVQVLWLFHQEHLHYAMINNTIVTYKKKLANMKLFCHDYIEKLFQCKVILNHEERWHTARSRTHVLHPRLPHWSPTDQYNNRYWLTRPRIHPRVQAFSYLPI